jgi:lipoprotein-releasing system permease protein
MNLRTEFFIARRYLRPKRSAVSVITCISIVGVTLGVAVLIVVLAVMTGFTDNMKEKLLETRAHLQIYSGFSRSINMPGEVIRIVKENGGKAIAIVEKTALIQKGRNFIPKQVIGVSTTNAQGIFDLNKHIVAGKYQLAPGEVLLSRRISQEFDAGIGDKIIIHSPERLSQMFKVSDDGKVHLSKADEVYLPEEYKVAGKFSFGKYDFDKNIIFMDLDDADELFGLPWGAATSVYVWIPDPFKAEEFAEQLKEQLPLMRIFTWQRLNRELLSILQLEKNMMFFLLTFIVLVAAFSITNTLITVVYQKTKEIGLLKALGASSGTVMRIFIFQGFIVGLMGSICGTGLGWLVVTYRMLLVDFLSKMTGRPVFPAEFYVFDELPARIVTTDLLWICISAIVLCTLGGLLPAWSAACQDPAQALRNE